MFSAELKVNGVTVMEVYGHRGPQTANEELEFTYDYSVWEPRYGRVYNGKVAHKYADGIDKLVAVILQATADEREQEARQ